MSTPQRGGRGFARRLAAPILLAGAWLPMLARPAGAAPQPQPYAPNPKPPTDGRIGSNYTPAYAVNQVQMWRDFRPAAIEKELDAAKEHFGLSMLRVYLHFINFTEDRANFLANLETFLTICDGRGIQPGFVFFDDCHRHSDIFLDRPTAPVKGYHNGRWAACPQDRHRTAENEPKLKAYVQEIVGKHRADPRVLFWEVFNEPNRNNAYSRALVASGYKWAKELRPVQPVLCCWDDHPHTDIVDAHNYSPDARRWDGQADLNPKKGAVFTEAGARWYPGRPRSHGTPVEVLSWLAARKAAGKSQPGVFLCWELMVGNSNCRWVWGTKQGAPEPTIPWCGLLWPDGEPVSLAESEAARRHATGKGRAIFFDHFNPAAAAAGPKASARDGRPGWTYYGGAARSGASLSGWFELDPHEKRLAAGTDAASAADCLIETKVMLKGETANAGVIFRAVDVGDDGSDDMRGYYVGLDTKALYLGKINRNWKQLARFDLTKLECKVVPGSWNLLRVEARGNRIKVWLNRMYGEQSKGLRIDHTDTDKPLLRGAAGLRTHNVSAWFDDVVVLPLVSDSSRPEPQETRGKPRR